MAWPGEDRAVTLGDKIAALETAIQRNPDIWEPDDAGQGDYAGTEAPALEWPETGRDADPDDDPEGHAGGRGDPAGRMDSFTPEDDLLDEEALRALVADIVRAELQGPLGERITRNVRKLVRREIQRALAAQDLD
ncbi:hypothetical protein AB1M95_09980 [Sulfitobacter sp. LCG007]